MYLIYSSRRTFVDVCGASELLVIMSRWHRRWRRLLCWQPRSQRPFCTSG